MKRKRIPGNIRFCHSTHIYRALDEWIRNANAKCWKKSRTMTPSSTFTKLAAAHRDVYINTECRSRCIMGAGKNIGFFCLCFLWMEKWKYLQCKCYMCVCARVRLFPCLTNVLAYTCGTSLVGVAMKQRREWKKRKTEITRPENHPSRWKLLPHSIPLLVLSQRNCNAAFSLYPSTHIN